MAYAYDKVLLDRYILKISWKPSDFGVLIYARKVIYWSLFYTYIPAYLGKISYTRKSLHVHMGNSRSIRENSLKLRKMMLIHKISRTPTILKKCIATLSLGYLNRLTSITWCIFNVTNANSILLWINELNCMLIYSNTNVPHTSNPKSCQKIFLWNFEKT